MTDHTPTPEAVYRWAESVASSGTGDAALIEIDIITPTGIEPVVIPLTQAGELYDMLSGVLAKHGAPKPHPEGCPGCETCDLATQLSAEREAHDAHRTLIARALALTTGSGWDAIQDCAAKTRKAAKERAAALQDARDELAAAGYPTDSNGWLILAPAIRKLAADVTLLRGNSEVDRREASNRRQALAGALGLGTGAPWDAITDRAREVAADLAGDAPWIRAHREDLEDAKLRAKEAEEGERRAMRQRQEMAEERYALQQRADLADRVKRTAAKDAAYALKRAEKAEAAIARVRDLADRLADGTEAGFRAALDVRAALDGEQPGRAKRSVTCGEPGWAEQERARMERLYTTAYFRAERLEKQLVAVRKAVADAKACGGEDAGCTVDHRDIITAIIDGEQPPATPAPAAISLPLIAPCARCHAATARCDTKGRFLCQRCDSIEQASGEHAGEPEPDDAELTADEARALADDLALQLYRADDALAFVAEMCDIADREGTPVTTTRVRDWLKGAQCARQAGLVFTHGPVADAVRRHHATEKETAVPNPRRFYLQRNVDVTGASGTGRVADGVLWSDGTVSVRWAGDRPSVVFWNSLDDAEAVHGNGGNTTIVWLDPEEQQ